MSKQDKNKNIMGFTLVELVITIVIVAILSVISVAVHREYVKKAIFTEGKVLVGQIVRAQSLYYMQNNEFFSWDPSQGGLCEELDIDARSNKYFRDFSMEPMGGSRSFGQKNSPQNAQKIAAIPSVIIRSFYYPKDTVAWIVAVCLYADGSTSNFEIYEEGISIK